MVMNKKLFAAIVVALLCAANVMAATSKAFQGATCAIDVLYNEEAEPGDAIIVRMTMRANDRRPAQADINAVAELHNEEKKVDSSRFFFANPNARRQNAQELLAYIPLSTWISAGEYSVKIIYTAFGSEPEKFSVPVTVVKKEFISETIPLDERNTNIRTDTSRERMAQIEKLNAILGTVNADVYDVRPFVPPVAPDTRRTSFFGDRRVFAYSTGRTATSEHYGIDYGVPTGTPVAACADGRVVLAENRITTGRSVVIEHAPGLYSLYYHMSALDVTEGERVKQGERLGLSGATGLATGPHLHWEVRLNMCAVSPDFFTGDYAYTKEQ